MGVLRHLHQMGLLLLVVGLFVGSSEGMTCQYTECDNSLSSDR